MYYLYNAHGDVVQLLNSSGEVTKIYNYDAYGNELTRDLNDSNPFRYCGEYYDTETGFIYLRARYYSPSTGRFISVDPAKDGLNWYSYCENNPVTYVDPWGLSMERDGITWYDSADKAAYAFAVNYNGLSIADDIEIATFIYSKVFYWYDGEYYSSRELAELYDGTGSLIDFYKQFQSVRMYYYDDDVTYGGRNNEDGMEYKYVDSRPKIRMGRIEAMVHTHGNVSNGGEAYFSVPKSENGKIVEYNDIGVAFMYKTYGRNAFVSNKLNEIHGIKHFVSYVVTPDGILDKMVPLTLNRSIITHVNNPFDDYYYKIPRYNK